MAQRPQNPRTVETLTHEKAQRKNIPTAGYGSVMQKEVQSPVSVAYERRNRDLDPPCCSLHDQTGRPRLKKAGTADSAGRLR
jgi:hypothetical protein